MFPRPLLLVEFSQRQKTHLALGQLRAVAETSEDAIVMKDLDGVITSWNKGAERVFGYAADEVIGKPVSLLIPADRYDEEPSILARIRKGHRVEPYETVRRRKDGSLIDISLTVSPLTDATGTVVGASKIARDITDKKRAEARQQLLLREMHHRVKNTFMLVNGIVALSARYAEPQNLAKDIQARLAALASRTTCAGCPAANNERGSSSGTSAGLGGLLRQSGVARRNLRYIL